MVREKIKILIQKTIKELQKEKKLPDFEMPEISVEHPEEKTHGDYSTNVAMIMAKSGKRNPIQIAKLVTESLSHLVNESLFDKVEVAKPGFINFFLKKEFFIKEIKRILKEENRYGSNKIGKGKRVVIDYSAPNIAKPFGIGHLRSTIIGQALYNIYKFLGWKCIGDNHLGDWGTQYGKLIAAIQRWGKKEIKDYSIDDLEKLYVRFHQEVEKNPKLEEEGRSWFKKLEKNDEKAKKIWQIFVNISKKEFNKIYKLLGVKIDYSLGESFYEGMLKKIIGEAVKRKVAQKSEGALIIKYLQDSLPPAMILKSDGGTTYLTRDLATVKYRLNRWKPDLIIYEVGADQELYFKQLFRAVEILGWAKKEKFFHVAHGLYRTKTGKLSTRKGETVHLEDVLNEAIERAKEIIEKSETGRGLSKKEKEKVAQIVGIGGVKYNDLKQHPSTDIIFDWGKILNLKGNSCPYLQYTYARCKSVIRKTKSKVDFKKIKVFDFNLEEENILRTIYKFPEIVKESSEKFAPNLICNFTFDLAQKYNLFYDLHPIIKAETLDLKNFRISLTIATAQVIKNTLNLMGISAPKRM